MRKKIKNKNSNNIIEMKKNKEPPDKEYYKCVKVPLKHVIKHPQINIPKITDATIKANKIIIHTLQFMKLYLLDYYNTNNKLPKILAIKAIINLVDLFILF